MVLLYIHPCLVHSRVLLSSVSITESEIIGPKLRGLSKSAKLMSSSYQDRGTNVHFHFKSQMYTQGSGPDGKGIGHK